MFRPNGSPNVISGQEKVDSFLAGLPKGQSFYKALISGCVLHLAFAGHDIRFMQFYNVTGPGADFSKAIADHATFGGSNLRKAHFVGAHLRDSTFDSSDDLREADFGAADLTNASLVSVGLADADMTGADLTNLQFAPNDLPKPLSMAEAARGLETLRSPENPVALNRLRQQFSDLGLTNRVHDLRLAIDRDEQSDLLHSCESLQALPESIRKRRFLSSVEACIVFSTRAVAVDATCQFGRRPWRPLGYIVLVCVFSTLILSIGLRRSGRHDVAIGFKNRQREERVISLQKLISRLHSQSRRRGAYFRFALALSISAVFNLPFKEVEVGEWLRMISSREYEFYTRGWVRTFTGFMSLLCFYLMALWVLSFLDSSLLG